MALVTIAALAVMMLFTTGVASAAERLEGVVRVRIADPTPGSPSKIREDKLLVTAGGTAYLLRGRAAKDAKVNHEVTVAGTVAGGTVEATSVTVGSPVAGVPPNGTTRVLLMLAYWTQPDSLTPAVAHDRFFNDGNAWYRDASYGVLGQTGDTTPWLRIAGPGGGCYANSYQIMQQAKDEAVKLGYNLSSYDNFSVYFPNCGADDASGYAAWAYVGSSQMWFNGYFTRREITHEQGHNYGLWHSHSYICDGGGLSGSCTYTEYGDDFDAMGGSSYSGHFSANQKTLLGWLGGGRTVDLSAGGTSTLVPMADDGTGPHAAVISVPDSSRKYWVEYRQPVDFDNRLPTWGTNGVLVHATGAGSGSPDTGGSLIDVSPADGTYTSSATLKPNSSWVTPEGIVIRVGTVEPAGASVTVRSGTSAPTSPTSVAGQATSATTGTITWQPPADDGGSPVTGYYVARDGGTAGQNPWSTTVGATARSQGFANLRSGATYNFSVAAINASGTGPALTVKVTMPPAGVPGVPNSVAGEATSNTSARITWAPPSTTGSSAITGYYVARDGGTAGQDPWSRTVTATARGQGFTNLTPGATYTLSVAAINGSGRGPAALVKVTVPSMTVPGIPTNVVGSVNSSSTASLSWGLPTSTGGAPITGYYVARDGGTGGQNPWSTTVPATTRSQGFSNLAAGSTYTFSVAAINSLGRGPIATVQVTMPVSATTPGPPLIGTASPGASGGAITATATWSPPTNTGGTAITGYRVRALRMSSTGAVLSKTTSAVQPATARSLSMALPTTGNYRFTVQAINSVGPGPQSPRSNLVAGR